MTFFLKAFIVALVYKTVLSYCRRSIAVWAALVSLLWFSGLNEMAGNPMVPVSLLNIVASILILPVFIRSVSAKRILAAGAVAGMAALVRYDTGIALFGAQASVVAIAIYLRVNAIKDGLRNFRFHILAYLIGFAAVTLPALSYYLARAPFMTSSTTSSFIQVSIIIEVAIFPFQEFTSKDLINSGFILLLRSFAFRFILQ